MPWKVNGKTPLGFSLAAGQNDRAIGKYVDSREIPEDMEDDHLDDDIVDEDGDEYESLIHVDAPLDLSSFPDTEDLNLISESNAINFLRLKFDGLKDITASIEILNVLEPDSIDFEDFESFNVFRYSNTTDQLYNSEPFILGSESP